VINLAAGLLNKLLGGALAGALIFSGVQTWRLSSVNAALSSAKEVIQDLTTWRDGMVSTVRLASGSPTITAKTAQAQVQAMGTSLVTLNAALKTSNDAAERLAEQKKEAEARAAAEASARRAAIARADQLAEQLRGGAEKPVDPLEMEAEVRRVQDLAYDAGL
jgi:hypothetical protein